MAKLDSRIRTVRTTFVLLNAQVGAIVACQTFATSFFTS
jgi:hypothetical protein